jgi:hypothetical protein
MLMPFRYLIRKQKQQGEKMDNSQELKAHLQDSNKARMYEDKKKKKIEDDIWEIENQYPYLHFDRDRHKFNKADVNELNKLYSKLRKIKEGQ